LDDKDVTIFIQHYGVNEVMDLLSASGFPLSAVSVLSDIDGISTEEKKIAILSALNSYPLPNDSKLVKITEKLKKEENYTMPWSALGLTADMDTRIAWSKHMAAYKVACDAMALLDGADKKENVVSKVSLNEYGCRDRDDGPLL
jgi:hypothetical protein